jgi:hypothetical protein
MPILAHPKLAVPATLFVKLALGRVALHTLTQRDPYQGSERRDRRDDDS